MFTDRSLANGSDDGFSPATGVIYDAKADDNAKLIVRLSLNGDSNNDQCFFDKTQTLVSALINTNSPHILVCVSSSVCSYLFYIK